MRTRLSVHVLGGHRDMPAADERTIADLYAFKKERTSFPPGIKY